MVRALLLASNERPREVEHVARAPERWPVVRGHYRQKVFTGPFPYVLIYRTQAEVVFVVAVAHQRRRPGYWVGR
jgi:plasmid stabilization system protein ParE